MAAGFGHLRLSPQAFWSMTVPEFSAAIRGLRGPAEADPMTRAALEALIALYPDDEETQHGR